jgi:hypothetical protein
MRDNPLLTACGVFLEGAHEHLLSNAPLSCRGLSDCSCILTEVIIATMPLTSPKSIAIYFSEMATDPPSDRLQPNDFLHSFKGSAQGRCSTGARRVSWLLLDEPWSHEPQGDAEERNALHPEWSDTVPVEQNRVARAPAEPSKWLHRCRSASGARKSPAGHGQSPPPGAQ